MIVTLNSDASYSQEHKIGTFAFTLVSNNGRVLKSGKLKNTSSSAEAEFRSILNGLHYLFNHTNWKEIDRVVINCDNQEVVNICNNKQATQWAYKLIKAYYKYGRDNKAYLEARKVKGHSRINDKRHRVNNIVDAHAKSELRKAIKKFNIQPDIFA